MDSLSNIKIATDPEFGEQLLRLYLGKYEHRFNAFPHNGGVILHSGPYPTLVVTYTDVLIKPMLIRLFEYINIEEDDPWFGILDHYQNELFAVSIEDPDGMKKMETAVTKSFLAGTQ